MKTFAAVAAISLAIIVETYLVGIPEKPAPKKIDRLAKEIELREGWYSCTGEAGEIAYHGAVTIRKTGGQYTVRWAMDGGAASGSVLGVGLRTDNLLSVGWNVGEIRGVSVYRIQADGVLEGNYVVGPAKDGRSQPEALTWEKNFAK